MIELYYYIILALPVILSSLGAGIGQGRIGQAALQALHEQPEASNAISRINIIGIAITETTAILGLVTSLMLLLNTSKTPHAYEILGILGIALAVGISGCMTGMYSARPVEAACQAVARQPFMHSKIINLMLVTQTLIMTPNIFGFLIGLLIKNKMALASNLPMALQLFSSGMSIGFGSIGPATGLSLFAFAACEAVGFNKKSFSKIITFTFIGEAIIETPLIFALIVALSILNTPVTETALLKSIACLAAALCIALSTIAPGFGSGKTGAQTCRQIAQHLQQYPALSKTTLLALAMIDTIAMYGLLVSLILIFSVAT